MVRDVIYHGITRNSGALRRRRRRQPPSPVRVHYLRKGQPGQSGWMTHAASHARFRRVDVISGQTKADA